MSGLLRAPALNPDMISPIRQVAQLRALAALNFALAVLLAVASFVNGWLLLAHMTSAPL